MRHYYNEIDPYAAQWLRNLIADGQIAAGDVDERSIVDVRADDLRNYTQCHFFAGIGGWSIALRMAGWDDARPVWTGSCPCQPFSAAGAGKAADDKRHLWPAWFSLIRECRPSTIFGEQVEAAIGWGWLDAVFADLESEGYACGATVLPACGVGAPHIRQRLWFVAHADGGNASAEGLQRSGEYGQRAQDGRNGELADAECRPTERRRHDMAATPSGVEEEAWQRQRLRDDAGTGIEFGDMAHANAARRRAGWAGEAGARRDAPRIEPTGLRLAGGLVNAAGEQAGLPGRAREPRGSFWSDLEWLPCIDGKARPTRSGLFPLAHGVQRRTSKLRAYGNAIVPQVAAEFIAASAAQS